MNDSGPSTPVFRMAPRTYVRAIAAGYAVPGCIALICCYIALAAAAVNDSRFFYVAVILTVSVVPMFLTLAWLRMLSRPDVSEMCAPQRWSLDTDGRLRISIYDYTGQEVRRLRRVSPGEIRSFNSGADNLRLDLVGGNVLLLPMNPQTLDLAKALIKEIDTDLA